MHDNVGFNYMIELFSFCRKFAAFTLWPRVFMILTNFHFSNPRVKPCVFISLCTFCGHVLWKYLKHWFLPREPFFEEIPLFPFYRRKVKEEKQLTSEMSTNFECPGKENWTLGFWKNWDFREQNLLFYGSSNFSCNLMYPAHLQISVLKICRTYNYCY